MFEKNTAKIFVPTTDGGRVSVRELLADADKQISELLERNNRQAETIEQQIRANVTLLKRAEESEQTIEEIEGIIRGVPEHFMDGVVMDIQEVIEGETDG